MIAKIGAWFIVYATTIAKINKKFSRYPEAGHCRRHYMLVTHISRYYDRVYSM
jgi:hypothetical protein